MYERCFCGERSCTLLNLLQLLARAFSWCGLSLQPESSLRAYERHEWRFWTVVAHVLRLSVMDFGPYMCHRHAIITQTRNVEQLRGRDFWVVFRNYFHQSMHIISAFLYY
jgi:hypothetical protein